MAIKYKHKLLMLPIDKLVILPQMRITMNQALLQALADNIAKHGLISPIMVSYEERNKKKCYVVIAGHRRIEAIRTLKNKKKHSGKIDSIVVYNLDEKTRLSLQMSENSQEPVAAHEAAVAFVRLWRLYRAYDRKITVRQFAKLIGRSQETVKNALTFETLPQRVKAFVQDGLLRYGAALEIARLPKELRMTWAISEVTLSRPVIKTKERVDKFFQELQDGQTLLFPDLRTAEAEKKYRRQAVDLAATRQMWNAVHYWSLIQALISNKKLAYEDSPLSMKSPLKVWRQLMHLAQKTLFILKERGHLKKRGKKDKETIALNLEELKGHLEK